MIVISADGAASRIDRGGTEELTATKKRPGKPGRFSLTLASNLTHRSEHDPEKWKPVFRKDHAPLKIWSAIVMLIPFEIIAL
jgi:hypothetical protein